MLGGLRFCEMCYWCEGLVMFVIKYFSILFF